MTKVKAVVVVVLLVGVGGAGALYGLNTFYQARIDDQVQCSLAGTDKQFIEHMQVQAFLAIQRLSQECQNSELQSALNRARPVPEGSATEAVKSALQPAHDAMLPLLDAIQKKVKSNSLYAISLDGRVVAKLPVKDRFGESLNGLPAVKECLGGISRDGFYEIGGKPLAVAITPVMDSRSKVSGCLMSARPLDSEYLATLTKETGTQAALFLRKTIVASTVDRNALQSLISRLDSSDVIQFGDPATDAPFLLDFTGRGYAARSVKLEGGTDAMHLAVILPLANMIAPLREAQMTLLMGVGALLIVGLLLGFLLSAKSDTREAERLRDAVRNLSDGNSSVLSTSGYSGIYQDLAEAIGNLTSSGQRRSPDFANSATADSNLGLQSTLDSQPPTAPEPSDLDFESLLGKSAKGPAPGTPQPPAPQAPAPEPEPAPAESAPPELPAELFAPIDPTPSTPEPVPAAPSAPAPVPASGPKVELPGELAGMFDDDTVEATALPPQPAAKSTPPPPPSIPPTPPDLGEEQEQITSSDYRPDATVIAQVPDELLKAAFTMEQQSAAGQAGAPEPSPIRAVEESPEDAHFREVFQQFIDTKKQCGESTVGLTFDRFGEKLRKNTADLKSRYKCRTVKFHVYVKNGKAALKATPLK